jgi:tight adherence protein B
MLFIALVFIGIFSVTALLIAASGTVRAQREKQALSRLDAVLAMTGDVVEDESVDVRKKEALFSSIPLLNRLLVRLEIASRLRRLLFQADLTWTPGRLLFVSLVIWVVAGYLIDLRTGVFALSFVLGLIPAAAPFAFVLKKRSRRLQKFEEGLPAAIDLMVSGLRSGHSIISAIGLVAREAPDPIGREFRVCFDEQNYGLELRTALENLANRVPVQDVRMIMTAILIQKETGGNLAEVLDKCAHVIRERFRLKREIRSRTAQGRLTGWVLSILPFALGLLLYLLNPDVVSLLWRRPMGVKMLYAASTMMLLGALIIRKIVRIRV